MKQRYIELAKEFHPDSKTSLDLPVFTANSLMANLTGEMIEMFSVELRHVVIQI